MTDDRVPIDWLDTSKTNPEKLRLALARPPIDRVTPSPEVAARTEAVFGKPLTPEQAVKKILDDVETYGDEAVIDYCRKIDGVTLSDHDLFVDEEEMAAALRSVDDTVVRAIDTAVENIRAYHQKQIERSWFSHGEHGEFYGQRLLPLERVACYVPGGTAPLLSSAIMSVVPADVAGVEQVIAATPCRKDGTVHPYVLVALEKAGAHRILKVGGAQAIAALAFGTTWIPKVDKIVGPGNMFVTLAKKEVYGRVGIDGLNGPSEVAIVADGSADPRIVAADLLAQAEHDSEAFCILFTDDKELGTAVADEIQRLWSEMERASVVEKSLAGWGAIVLCRDKADMIHWTNHVAAEHVQLLVKEPWSMLPHIRFAGAIFVGPLSAVPLGDYIAGPNHILPTNGTARFASPLGVYDFMRRTSILSYTELAYTEVAEAAIRLARIEGLHGHADALQQRLDDRKKIE